MIRYAAVVPHPPLLVPGVGRGEERKVERTEEAYRRMAAEVAKRAPARIVLISSHVTRYQDYIHIPPEMNWSGSFHAFGDRLTLLEATGDPAFLARITAYPEAQDVPYGTAGATRDPVDHATLVPLYFLHEAGVDCPIIRIGTAGLPLTAHYRLGQQIQRAAEESAGETVVIASGDLSHRLKDSGPYGFNPMGPVYDEKVMRDLTEANFGALLRYTEAELEGAGECGHPTFVILGGALDGKEVTTLDSSYEGPFGVGYGVVTYQVGEKDDSRRFLAEYEDEIIEMNEKNRSGEHPYVTLARETIESHISGMNPPKLPESFPQKKAAVFVTLHKFGQLRGCIGTLTPRFDMIDREISKNAISAALEDPRFSPVEESELPYLEVSVDVLSEPEKVDSIDALDPKIYGVIVKKGSRSGVLLPDLDGIDTAKDQVSIAKKKAGIGESQEADLFRFTVDRHV